MSSKRATFPITRREEGGLLSSQSAPRSATHGSPLSPGWCGQWRVSGIVTGAESTSRQFGFEALRPLQRRVRMQELRLFKPRTQAAHLSHKCACACVAAVGGGRGGGREISEEVRQPQRWSPALEVCPRRGHRRPQPSPTEAQVRGDHPVMSGGWVGAHTGRASAAFPF